MTLRGRCRGGADGTKSPLGTPELIAMYKQVSKCMPPIDELLQKPVDLFAGEPLLRNAVVEYLGKYPGRLEILSLKPRVLSNPPCVLCNFPGLKSEHKRGGKRGIPTTFDEHSTGHYKLLLEQFANKLPGAFSESEMQCFQTLLTYEMGYLRGCDLQWLPQPDGKFPSLAMLQDKALTVRVRADSGEESSSSLQYMGLEPPPKAAPAPHLGAEPARLPDPDSDDSLRRVLDGKGQTAAQEEEENGHESDDSLGNERDPRAPKRRNVQHSSVHLRLKSGTATGPKRKKAIAVIDGGPRRNKQWPKGS